MAGRYRWLADTDGWPIPMAGRYLNPEKVKAQCKPAPYGGGNVIVYFNGVYEVAVVKGSRTDKEQNQQYRLGYHLRFVDYAAPPGFTDNRDNFNS